MYLLTPNISMLPATPANSVVVLRISATSRKNEEGDLDAGVLPDEVREPLAGDDAHPGVHLLDDEQDDKGRYQRPEELVAELRPGDGVRRDAAHVVVDAAGDDAGAEDGSNISMLRMACDFLSFTDVMINFPPSACMWVPDSTYRAGYPQDLNGFVLQQFQKKISFFSFFYGIAVNGAGGRVSWVGIPA